MDFDGILAEDNGQFPLIGPPIDPMVEFVKELIDSGHEVILWTSRTGFALSDVVGWCLARDLHFCSVNENAPSNIAKYQTQYPNGTRKVYADIYIDDHDSNFKVSKHKWGLEFAIREVINNIRRLIKWEEEN